MFWFWYIHIEYHHICFMWKPFNNHITVNENIVSIYGKTLLHVAIYCKQFQFSCSVMSNSLRPHGLPGVHVHHQLPELSQTHVHQLSDVIQPSHPLPPPFPPAFNFSQHQGLFKWVSSSYQVVKVLELQLQHKSLQWISRIDFLQDWLVGSPCCAKNSHESSPTPQFKSINSSVLSFLYGQAFTYMTTGKTIVFTRWTFVCVCECVCMYSDSLLL